jgi:hypothetical protein
LTASAAPLLERAGARREVPLVRGLARPLRDWLLRVEPDAREDADDLDEPVDAPLVALPVEDFFRVVV